MEKDNFLDAIIIRIVLTCLILTALGLKTLEKLGSMFFQVKIVKKTDWDHERQLAASNRQTF
jgi:hypothetical protein